MPPLHKSADYPRLTLTANRGACPTCTSAIAFAVRAPSDCRRQRTHGGPTGAAGKPLGHRRSPETQGAHLAVLGRFINHVVASSSSPAGLLVSPIGAGTLRLMQNCQVYKRVIELKQASLRKACSLSDGIDREAATPELCRGMPSVKGCVTWSPRTRAWPTFRRTTQLPAMCH